jgi:hypothetical protein
LYKWFLAIPQYFELAGLFVAACLGSSPDPSSCSSPGSNPEAIRDLLVSAFRYALRVEAYVEGARVDPQPLQGSRPPIRALGPPLSLTQAWVAGDSGDGCNRRGIARLLNRPSSGSNASPTAARGSHLIQRLTLAMG